MYLMRRQGELPFDTTTGLDFDFFPTLASLGLAESDAPPHANAVLPFKVRWHALVHTAPPPRALRKLFVVGRGSPSLPVLVSEPFATIANRSLDSRVPSRVTGRRDGGVGAIEVLSVGFQPDC
jgi:hypothetical protein